MSVTETTIDTRINHVEAEIEKVQAEIKELKVEIKKEGNAEEKKALRKTEEQLREEKKQLNDRLNILLQLRLQNEAPAANITSQGRPPRSPLAAQRIRRPSTLAPASTGKEVPNQTKPRKSPSSDEGREEGLKHASDDDTKYMQCTSTPTTMALLQLLENAVNDHQNKSLDEKYVVAARYVAKARTGMLIGKLPSDVRQNERFLTGAMANAINAVLKDGYCVVHQGCLGVGTTHSDLSATRIGKDTWPTTIMVGEGKWQAANLRKETRGQLFNELLRHRAIDSNLGEVKNGPILLFAFDQSLVEIDLAFPSTKNGKLETDGIVSFEQEVAPKMECFWTVKILRTSIQDGLLIPHLSIVLRFISDALQKLHGWQEQLRLQHKIPFTKQVEENNIEAVDQYCGENVTILEEKKGSKFVCKEYAYHLRQECPFMLPFPFIIAENDKRHPPPKELLNALGQPYSEWEVHEGPFRTFTLWYRFIEGSSYSPTVSGWLQILQQIKKMHEIGFIHGDLLPRNVLFDTDRNGYVIDFDLTRKMGGTYVKGYNNMDFKEFRHENAEAGGKMSKDHDVHSLHKMSCYFFDFKELLPSDLDGLISFFEKSPDLAPARFELDDDSGAAATDSPRRS